MTAPSVAAIVPTQARERPGRTAAVEGERAVTYAELDQLGARVARALVGSGIRPGDRVGYLGRNSITHLESMAGASRAGAVTVPFNWRLSEQELAYVIGDSTARLLVVEEEFAAAAHRIVTGLEAPPIVVVDGAAGRSGYRQWRDASGEVETPMPTGPACEGVCFHIYSSGTTGRPKGVLLTSAGIMEKLAVVEHDWGLDDRTVGLLSGPVFHIAGTSVALAGLDVGATQVIARDTSPTAVVDLVRRHRITFAGTVPAVLNAIIALPPDELEDVTSLDLVMYGASSIPRDVLRRSMELLGCDFVQSYGLTETAGTVTNLSVEDHRPGAPEHRLASVGRVNGNVEVRIVDPETSEDVPPGTPGEIWLRTTQNMVGYFGLPDETARTLTRDGWLRTGDVGRLDPDGYLYLVDRLKDVVISGGENVYPAEIEAVLRGHPSVADCAVIGLPSTRWGESPVAVVVGTGRPPDEADLDEADLDEADLIEYCRERLAHYKAPRRVDRVDEIPRTAVGKVDKARLRAERCGQVLP
ncbi:MAG TPA: AMP-binding protein [Acidimicrobiales bacterium]|nr:AMP-binding protein [Acidimicrobiales bacterium]